MSGLGPLWRGVVNRVSAGQVYVAVPRFDPGAEWGPCEVLESSLTPLAAGDRVLVAFLEGRFDDVVVLRRLGAGGGSTPLPAGSVTAAMLAAGALTPAWHRVGDPGEPAFTANWGNYYNEWSPGRFSLDALGLVRLEGLVARAGGPGAGESIVTLPAAYRPERGKLGIAYGGAGANRVDVMNDGRVLLRTGDASTFLSLWLPPYPARARAFAPPDIANLGLWYRPDSLVLADAAAIATLYDESNLGTNVTMATAGKRPALRLAVLNGHAVARFDGADDELQNTALPAYLQVDSFTYFVVAKASASGQTFLVLGDATGGQARQYLDVFGGKARFNSYYAAASFNGITGATTVTGGFHVMAVRRSAPDNNLRLWVDGLEDAAAVALGGAAANYGTTKHLHVGAFNANNFLNGDVAAIVGYTRDLTDPEVAQVNADLKALFGL